MLSVVVIFLILFAFLSPKIFRLLRVELNGLQALLEKFLPLRTVIDVNSALIDPLPEKYHDYWQKQGLPPNLQCRILSVAGKGVKGLRHSTGYFCLADNAAFFVARRSFRFRQHQIDLKNVSEY